MMFHCDACGDECPGEPAFSNGGTVLCADCLARVEGKRAALVAHAEMTDDHAVMHGAEDDLGRWDWEGGGGGG